MDVIENLKKHYLKNSLIRSLIQLVPFGVGSGIDVALSTYIDNIKQKRLKIFFDELNSGSIKLSPELVESENFLHCYFSTLKAALNSRRQEKNEMFSRLLKSTIRAGNYSSIDEFEEYLKILDELSLREFQILIKLEEYESENPLLDTDNGNELKRATRFWESFVGDIKNLGVPENEVDSIINRLNRSGCFETFVGNYYDYTGGKGKTTATFKRLKKLIETENKRVK